MNELTSSAVRQPLAWFSHSTQVRMGLPAWR